MIIKILTFILAMIAVVKTVYCDERKIADGIYNGLVTMVLAYFLKCL